MTSHHQPRPLSYNPGAAAAPGTRPLSYNPGASAPPPGTRPLSLNPGGLKSALASPSPAPSSSLSSSSTVATAAAKMSVDVVYRPSPSAGNSEDEGFSFDMTGGGSDTPTPVPSSPPVSAGSAKPKQRTIVGSGNNSGKQKTVVEQRTIVESSGRPKQAPAVAVSSPAPTKTANKNKKKKKGWFWWLWGSSPSPKPRRPKAAGAREAEEEEEEEVAEFDFDTVRKEAQQREEEARAAAEERRMPASLPSQRMFGSRKAPGAAPSKKPTGGEVISGVLLKRAKKTGQWNSRQFTLYDDKQLTWLKSDDKTVVSFALTPPDQVQVRDVKFGVKKFMFEITNGDEVLVLSAAGETEKQEWLRALGLLGEEEASVLNPAKGRKSLAMLQKGTVKQVKHENEAAIILGITNRGEMPTTLKSKQANERLKDRLNLSAPVTSATAGFSCSACDTKVFKPEEVRLRDYVILHRHCFTCATCDELLTLDSYQQLAHRVYCRKHFVELYPREKLWNLPKPNLAGGKRRPASNDKKHALENCIQIVLSPAKGDTIWVSTSSKFERDRWVLVLCNAIATQELKRVVWEAQKVDMMTALECQMELEAFGARSDCVYSAFIHQLQAKSWQRKWYELTPTAQLLVCKSDLHAKKPQRVVQLSHATVLLDSNDSRLNGPLSLLAPS